MPEALTRALVLTLLAGSLAQTASLRESALAGDFAAIRPLGPAVLPELVALYRQTREPKARATLAYVFYNLGWKSEAAKAALLQDVHTNDSALRLQVQWALGRVSDSPEVVDVLLENMRRDSSPLFRDKAACALAYDQIHLEPAQKLRLFEGLIDALEDTNPQVRQIALQALRVLTGQTKDFAPHAAAEDRARGIAAWRRWLGELRAQL